ncbi:MAG: DUF1549 domain-containing protein [Verrucomicrobiaceae bacterium]|nr:DUF1549 domain-containing protein [Verrucomicrobiaceae bacterium]
MKPLLVIGVVSGLAFAVSQAADITSGAREIDRLVQQGLAKQKLTPNKPASDEVFLRRVYLDVIGRIPTAKEAEAFYSQGGNSRRAELIDRLLASDGYVHHFFNYWADVFRAQSQGVGDSASSQQFMEYIRQSLRVNKPYDQMAREMIAAEGTVFKSGAIGYYVRDRGMNLDNVSNTTRIFLGTRMECAQCHDHPFDRWTQMDFYKMAAFSNNMNTTNYRSKNLDETQKRIREDKSLDKETQDMMRRALTDAFRPLQSTEVVQGTGKLRLPHDYKYSDAKPKDVVEPAAMFGAKIKLTKASNPIQEYAKWMTSPENPRFTTVITNRLWRKVMGVALIEPFDEIMDNSVASNPDLMKFLERQMVAMKYDMKAFLRLVLNSKTYQAESTKEDLQPGTPYYFQGPVFRRMSAEQIWDSVVTLVNPQPDSPNWSLREREHRELENRRQLAMILDGTEPSLLFDAAKRVAAAMKEQNKGFNQLRKDLEVARAKDDKVRVKEIQSKLSESQRVMRETISRSFYEAAKQSKNAALLARLEKISNGSPMDMAMMNIMNDARVDAMKEMPISDSMKSEMSQEAKLLNISKPKEMASYERYRKTLHQSWSRAAEMPSPAPRGHFLREYGQSDRDIIENASTEASVPQALTMLNGSIITQIASGWSALAMNLRQAEKADMKIDTLFLSLFSRKPTVKEKALLLNTIDDAGGAKNIWDDIILGAVSTQRFLFIE